MSVRRNAFRSERNSLWHSSGGIISPPLLFIVYINDLPNCLKHTTSRMFTAVGETLGEMERRSNEDLMIVRKWLSANLLSFNIAKTEYVLIGLWHGMNNIDAQPGVKIGSQSIKRVKHAKVLGVQVDENVNWGKTF
ncbi:Hypothetical predicted protein [Paramuricea clavata]|uniref:Uncharacterized protein n=1 Tax=Paramuricea clavata TaxID=317549 RepID=A0A7D9LQT0_PARCT|nr:Hypothetical predicted protein [Paramuricea clavata]